MSTNSKPAERESIVGTQIEPLIDERECSRVTGRSVKSLQRDRVLGTGIPYVKLQGLVRYRPDDLRTYIERNLHGGENSR